MDVAIVLDLSGSIDIVYDLIIRFAEELIYGLPIDQDRANIALVTYMDDATIHFNLNTYDSRRELLIALSFAGSGGKTNTAAALRLTNREVFTGRDGDRSKVDNKVILITDGRSNVRARNTVEEASNLKDNDSEIYVVAVGDDPDLNEIHNIASDPVSDFVVSVRQSRDVKSAVRDLLNTLCGEDL